MKVFKLSIVLFLILVFFNSCNELTSPPPEPIQNTENSALEKRSGEGDAQILSMMEKINKQLAAKGLNIAVESIEFFTIGYGRPSTRIHQRTSRWVPDDERRYADSINITYAVDQSFGATASGLTNAQTEAAIDGAMSTWELAMKKVDVIKRSDPGTDITIYDAYFGFGDYGDPFYADIVEAGFYPLAFFEAVAGPTNAPYILAFTITFVFINPETGNYTDINGDNYLDTALKEVYFNDTWGDPAGWPGYPWGIDVNWPGVDVESVALHENGHSFELGHFGPPPLAVMNPVYSDIQQSLLSTDLAGLNIVWSSWPNP